MWNATPRSSNGCSPSRILLNRAPRMPGIVTVRDGKDPQLSGRSRWMSKEADKESRNDNVSLNWSPVSLEPGLRVLLQDPVSKRFNIPAKVVSVRPSGRSAYVDCGGGKTYLRNRRFMALDPDYPPPSEAAMAVTVVMAESRKLKSALRRGSSKKAEKRVRFRLAAEEVDTDNDSSSPFSPSVVRGRRRSGGKKEEEKEEEEKWC